MDRDYFGKDFHTTKIFPNKIFVNQLGYKPDAVKRAVITLPCETFTLHEAGTGRIAYSGMTEHFGVDIASQDDVYIADFSSFSYPGRYYIKANGESSFCFDIGKNVYRGLADDLLKAFYYLRCGEELTEERAGVYTHPACHTERAIEWDNHDVSADVHGGWHDAGDYGRYVTPGATTLAHLLYAYTMFESCRTDTLLEECRVELEWMLKMQRADGGVYHKVTTQFHAPFVMPQEDKAQLYLFPVSSIATADMAAVCALASRIYKDHDGAFAQRLLDGALKAGKWLEENPDFLFVHPENHNTGSYGEWRDFDNRFWAWTELYLTTGDSVHKDQMLKALDAFDEHMPLTALGTGMVSGFGALSYILWGEDDRLKAKYSDCYIRNAEYLAKMSDECGWGAAMNENSYYWGSTMGLGKNGMVFAIADYAEKSDRFKGCAHKQLDFLLGVNATGYSWVTGHGEFCINYPHLRTAHADGIEKCMPGYVSGGPNKGRQDHVARKMIPEGTPPMKCFIDEVGSFSTNEITIYWNSPFVFLTGYLNEE